MNDGVKNISALLKIADSCSKRTNCVVTIKAIGEGKSLFFTKINFGFHLKALSANYKLVFTEFKNII